jgi:hypothetical protein
MDLQIVIAGDRVVYRQDGANAVTTPLTDFVAGLSERADASALPDAIPEGVRFIRRRGDVVVLVLEEKPQVRTVRWLVDGSSVPFGAGAVYRQARLAFPFVVAVIAFRRGALTGYQQCFYRTAALGQASDELLCPNLLNVAEAYGQKCWLCLAQLQTDLMSLSWSEKVREIRRHLWGAGFNRSAEMHEGMSYWTSTRVSDPRVVTIDAWERASLDDPFFPLTVGWKTSGKTVGETMEMMIRALAGPPLTTVPQLAQLMSLLLARAQKPAKTPR